MILAKGIYKKFQNVEVLKGVDFEAQEREVISIIGSSGAGKTTFLQILGTLLRPDAGSIIFNGQDLSELNDTELSLFRNQNIGFVYQFHNLLPEFSAIENVCIPGFIGKGNVQKVKKRAEELLDYLKIIERKDHKPSELSGGEQQRVAVARALINQPNIIMADEPSGNLDTETKKELHQLFFDLKDEFGQTFIIVTHDDALAQMADRTMKMKDGKFVS